MALSSQNRRLTWQSNQWIESEKREDKKQKDDKNSEQMQKVSRAAVIVCHTWSSILIMDRQVSIYPKICSDKSNLSLSLCRAVNVELVFGCISCLCVRMSNDINMWMDVSHGLNLPKKEVSLKSRWLVLFGFPIFHSDSMHEMPYQTRLNHN